MYPDTRIDVAAMKWHMPKGLANLEGWLAARNVDVSAFRSDRQALHIVAQLSGEMIRWPDHGKSCVPALLRLQRRLCPAPPQSYSEHRGRQPWRSQPEPFLKSKGPASRVRSVSDETRREIAVRLGVKG